MEQCYGSRSGRGHGLGRSVERAPQPQSRSQLQQRDAADSPAGNFWRDTEPAVALHPPPLLPHSHTLVIADRHCSPPHPTASHFLSQSIASLIMARCLLPLLFSMAAVFVLTHARNCTVTPKEGISASLNGTVSCDFFEKCCEPTKDASGVETPGSGCCLDMWIAGGLGVGAIVVFLILLCACCICCMHR